MRVGCVPCRPDAYVRVRMCVYVPAALSTHTHPLPILLPSGPPILPHHVPWLGRQGQMADPEQAMVRERIRAATLVGGPHAGSQKPPRKRDRQWHEASAPSVHAVSWLGVGVHATGQGVGHEACPSAPPSARRRGEAEPQASTTLRAAVCTVGIAVDQSYVVLVRQSECRPY